MRKIIFICIVFISFVDGACLLALEVLSSKILAPVFGSSFHVWSTMLLTCISGLTFGYFLSFKYLKSQKFKNIVIIHLFLLLSLIICFFTYLIILDFLLSSTFIVGLILSSFILFFPIFSIFGLISPSMINFLQVIYLKKKHIISPLIFSISTFGSVVGIYFFGFYLIPIKGISFSFVTLLIMMFFNFLILLVSYILLKNVFK